MSRNVFKLANTIAHFQLLNLCIELLLTAMCYPDDDFKKAYSYILAAESCKCHCKMPVQNASQVVNE